MLTCYVKWMKLAEVRVILKKNQQLARVLSVDLVKTRNPLKPYDVYCRSPLRGYPKGIRSSYHSTGTTVMHILDRHREFGPEYPTLTTMQGAFFLGRWSGEWGPVQWGYSPKESSKRSNLAIDLDQIHSAPGWAADAWALGPNVLPSQVLNEKYSNFQKIVSYCSFDATVKLLAVVWTFSDELWAEVEHRGERIYSIGITEDGYPSVVISYDDTVHGNPFNRVRCGQKKEERYWRLDKWIGPVDGMSAVDAPYVSMATDISEQVHVLEIDPDSEQIRLAPWDSSDTIES